jgi:hypothetical protein
MRVTVNKIVVVKKMVMMATKEKVMVTVVRWIWWLK